MPHTDIDLLTHLLLALYPAASFFVIEIIARYTNVRPWRKSVLQGLVSIAFAVAYIIIIDAIGLAIALFIFAPLLFIHARNLKNREYTNNSGGKETRI